MKNKSLLFLVFSILLVLVSCKPNSGDITVFENGKTEYKIITAEGASDEAKELAKALADLSGASPGVLSDLQAETALEILIGDTNRAATAALVKKLQAVSTASAFHYIIAEKDGKLIILSDSSVGYIYALNYIKQAYIAEGRLSMPADTYDIKQVIWDEYYASDIYKDRLTSEVDKNRYEEGKNQLENEMNRYDGPEGNTIMTVEQAIEQYKKQAASFNTADFGEYTSDIFTSAKNYGEINIYPSAAHPRILFTDNKSSDSEKSALEQVRENLKADENSAAYERYIILSDIPCDGKFKTVTGNMTHNYDADIVSKIEAKAFRYVMERNTVKYPNKDDDPASIYGYEAIVAVKNAMLTINVPHTVGDWCRTYGYLMYVMACVYDWCYELMTETDKTQMVAGGVNLLGAHFEMVCHVSSNNKVPTGQGAVYDHGAEDQLLVDYLSFAIACYSEAPEIYKLVAGRILNEYTEAQDYLMKSNSHWEGSMYGMVRTASTVVSNILFNKMTDGREKPFSDKIAEAVTTATYYIRPDGYVFRIGDMNENNTGFQFMWMANSCFYAGNLYNNSYLKNYAYEYLNGFSSFTNTVAGLSAVQFLAVNDPHVSHAYTGTAPLTRTSTSPNTGLFAKSSNDENAFSIYMTMPESYALAHAHMECGSFQIYYKGALATDSGAYTEWGGTHHMGYSIQTVSSNSLLIYNPALATSKNSTYQTLIYSGGQSIALNAKLPKNLEDILNNKRANQCISLGVANVEKDGKYLYSYMGGDMTGAYDSDTVSEVTRYMVAVATGDTECPYAFLTFDRITSLDASYHKSALIHVQEEPAFSGNYFAFTNETDGKLVKVESSSGTSANYATIINGDGKLVVQTVGYDTEYTVIGGEGREFWIAGVDNENYSLENGKNIPHDKVLVDGSLEEYGWGRIEISPKEAAETNYMLTVMYVTDASNNKAPTKAVEVVSDNLAGAVIFGKAVMFPENNSLLTKVSSFTLTEKADCYIAGVEAGTWILNNEKGDEIGKFDVKEGENLLTFSVNSKGTYTITPIK